MKHRIIADNYPLEDFTFAEQTQEIISEETEILSLEKQSDKYKIVLFNDDVNTFDYVIQMLVSVCDHSLKQAEQCAMIVHYKGKCDVKSGTYQDLLPRCSALLNGGLTAEIQ